MKMSGSGVPEGMSQEEINIIPLEIREVLGLKPVRVETTDPSLRFWRLVYALNGVEQEYGLRMDTDKIGEDSYVCLFDRLQDDPDRAVALEILLPEIQSAMEEAFPGLKDIREMIQRQIIEQSNASKNLRLAQTEKHYEFEPTGGSVTVRTIEPSKPYGAWPGNNTTIRIWKICPPGQVYYRPCTQEEVKKFEELTDGWKQIDFVDHPTLGKVCVERK